MASSSRPVHQDYIARIRYSNALPPPPNPPKLLEIPNTGLASGHYTSAGFASRLHRDQPLNIEADAELGMPIDLIGLPGVFDGDESIIQISEHPPPVHPHDKPLLRPASVLGKPLSMTSGVSFLRRTEYITTQGASSRFESTTSKELTKSRSARRKKAPEVAKDDPVSIIRSIVKGFNIAYPRDAYTGPDGGGNIRGAEITAQERDAWANPRHPTNPKLRLLDAYPLLPDPEACTDTGDYVVMKFQTNPIPNTTQYDERVDAALLRVLDQSEESKQRHAEEMAAAEADPTLPRPFPLYDYEFFLPQSTEAVKAIKRKFSVMDADNDDPSLYDYVNQETGKRSFKYERIRAYETYQQTGDQENTHGDVVAMALHDPESNVGRLPGTKSRLPKGAYFYPIASRTFVRPRRTTVPKFGMSQVVRDDEEDKVDVIEVQFKAATEEDLAKRTAAKSKYDPDVEIQA